MSGSRKSTVWNCFIKTISGGKCKLCHKELKSCGNTTNLMSHLVRRHGFKRNQHPGTLASMEEEEMGEELSNHFEVHEGEQSIENPGARSDVETETSASTSSVKSEVGVCSSQAKISDLFSDISSFKDGGNKSIQLTDALIYMIAKDNLSLNTTEKEGFKYFIKKALPHFNPPGRTKITQLLDDRHAVLHKIIKQRLLGIEHVSITADVWTDTINTRSFLGATVHFIHENRLCSLVISLKELTETHTSEFLVETLKDIFNEWGITTNKICAIITDNGANMVKAVTSLVEKNKHLPCFSHTLNLVAQKICDEENVSSLLSAVKAVVTYFKHCVSATDELRKVSHLKLVQSVVTRWNSSFLMLERFLKLRDEVGTILLRFPKSPRMLTASEIQEAQEVIHVLRPVEAASREVCGDHYVTASKIIPIVNMLQQQVSSLNFETTTGQFLKNAFMREMNKRFGRIEEIHLLAIATLLDARFKRIHFNNPIASSQAMCKIRAICDAEIFQQKGNAEREAQGQSSGQDNTAQESASDVNIWSYHKKLVCAAAASSDSDSSGADELKHYLNQKVIDINDDPIQFWAKHKFTYPALSRVSTQFLTIVGTSVPSERLFSKAGNIIDPNRNRLTSTRLSNLVFLNSLPLEDWHLQ